MKRNIMNNRGTPRVGLVAVLAMVVSAGLGCSAQVAPSTESSSTASTDQFINVALATPPTFTASTGTVNVTMKNETAEIYVNAADSSLMVNGVQAVDYTTTPPTVALAAGTKANIKVVAVADAAGATHPEILILNYVNGLFGLGTASVVGTTVNFAAGANNTLVVKGTPQNDNFAIGVNGISLTNGAKTPTKDVTVAGAGGVKNYDFYLGAGDDTFSSGGNAAVGGAFGAAVSIYGGPGNDTLNETASPTIKETFSGGPGTDTVDYSARPATVALVGTIAVTNASANIVGTSTLFQAGSLTSPRLQVGQRITFASQVGTYYTVASITDDTHVAISPAYSGTTAASTAGTVPSSVSVVLDSTGTNQSGYGVWAAACTPGTTQEQDVIIDADIIKGTPGDDQMMGDLTGAVTLNGGLGNDTFCQGGDARMAASDTMIGGGGVDTVDYSARTHSLTVVMDAKTLSGDPAGNGAKSEGDVVGQDVANVKLGSGGGTYTGNALNNTFFAGTAGSSVVNGLAGDDTLDEGPDANNGGTDTFHGGAGTDTVTYHSRTAAITVVMDGKTTGGDGAGTEKDLCDIDVENLFGGSGADALTGNALDNDIEGGAGGDTLCGLGGNDTLVGNLVANDGSNSAHLHGNDCADAVAEPGAFNQCFYVGTGGTPASAGAATTADCQLFQL